MTVFAPKKNECSYFKADGTICGAVCIRDICAEHVRCAPLKKCLNCHRGTQSITGFCGAEGACRTKQRAANARVLRNRKSFEARKTDAMLDRALDLAADDLMKEFEGQQMGAPPTA